MATFPGFLICCLVHQALKPAPFRPPPTWFGSFPTALCVRGLRGPLLGVLLCCLQHQALKWPNWLASISYFSCQSLKGPPGWVPLLFSASGAEMATHVGVLFCCSVHQALKGPTWLGPSLLLNVSGA